MSERILRLGRDQSGYGEYWCGVTASGACTLSVGADRESPSLAAKGDPTTHPNEDALFFLDDGSHCILAVADSHFGAAASHRLLELLDEALPSAALGPARLSATVESLSDPTVEPRSACAFLVALHDRERGEGFGLSFGDCSFVLLGGEGGARRLNTPDEHWVTPARAAHLASWLAKPFRFRAGPECLLLAFTDGIDGCHYGHPETSVGLSHLEAIFTTAGPQPETCARLVTELALAGVDGHPGGQDNIALIAARG